MNPQDLTPREFVERMTLPVRQAMASVRWLEGRVRNRPKLDELTPEKAALTDGDCVSQEILLVAVPQLGFLARAVRGGGAQISLADADFASACAKRRGTQLLVSHGLPANVRARAHAALLKPVLAAGGAIGVAPLLEGCCGALRLASDASGLSRRAWISALPTLEAGGCVETLDGALPERFEPGIAGVVVGSNDAEIVALRELLG